jgi:hypothetical protein
MPETAKELGLEVSDNIDERDNIHKSTYAACKVLASYYLHIRKKYGVSSWVLTAAAYNFGIGNIFNAINRQGKDYFSMKLNAETAVYVYKIIAVKELFEYPELYMKDFGYNVFNAKSAAVKQNKNVGAIDTTAFTSMVVKVAENDGSHPVQVTVKAPPKTGNTIPEDNTKANLDINRFKYVAATIKGRYKKFQDGAFISIELLENLEVKGNFNRKGNFIKGKGWLIGERIFIDLGFGDHDVTLIDITGKKGIAVESLKNNETILLKVEKM